MARADVFAYRDIALNNVSIEIENKRDSLQSNKYLIKKLILKGLHNKIVQKENQLEDNVGNLAGRNSHKQQYQNVD